jgi:hypothetical protein
MERSSGHPLNTARFNRLNLMDLTVIRVTKEFSDSLKRLPDINMHFNILDLQTILDSELNTVQESNINQWSVKIDPATPRSSPIQPRMERTFLDHPRDL